MKAIANMSLVPGITNTIGRIISGCLADLENVNSLLMHNIAIILGGVSCILVMFANTYIAMCVFCAFFGLCVGKCKIWGQMKVP